MRNFLKKSILFALFLVLFSAIVNFFFLVFIATTDLDFKKRLESQNFQNPDYKILVLGSSIAEYGLDTELLSSKGFKSFNLAVVGSSVRTQYIQLAEYIEKYQRRPEYVLMVLNSSLEEFDKDGIQPVIEFTMKGHKYGVKDIPISKFRWAGMEILKKAFSSEYRKMYTSYGQKKTTRITPDNSKYQSRFLDIKKFESSQWIGEIARLCKESGIKLFIIEIPGVNETQNVSELGPYQLSFTNGHSAALFNFNNQDFCKKIDSYRDWSGMSHFNMYGAQKFTSELMTVLSKDYISDKIER